MRKTTITDFSHLAAMRPAVRSEDLPPGTAFAHLLRGTSNSPSRVEGWSHRTRVGAHVDVAATTGKERAR